MEHLSLAIANPLEPLVAFDRPVVGGICFDSFCALLERHLIFESQRSVERADHLDWELCTGNFT